MKRSSNLKTFLFNEQNHEIKQEFITKTILMDSNSVADKPMASVTQRVFLPEAVEALHFVKVDFCYPLHFIS